MRSDLKARAGLAAEIAGVDRDRLNEAIAANHYPCAPATVRGSSRLFDLNDLLALWVYGELLRREDVPRLAGAIACRLREMLRDYPDAQSAVLVHPSIGSSLWFNGAHFDHNSTHVDSREIISFEVWPLASRRDRIQAELVEASQEVGNE